MSTPANENLKSHPAITALLIAGLIVDAWHGERQADQLAICDEAAQLSGGATLDDMFNRWPDGLLLASLAATQTGMAKRGVIPAVAEKSEKVPPDAG